MESLIKKIISIGQQHCPDTSFNLIRENLNTWIIQGNSNAWNIYKNNGDNIKVLHWFDDFWIYFVISFNKINNEYKSWEKDKREGYINLLNNQFIRFEENYFQTFISISIFQGDRTDNTKTQLFRAEWDNYENLSEKHPQPHWHIYPYKYAKKIHDDFEDFIELTETDENFNTYKTNKENTNIIDLKKVHFAMNGQWSENKTDVHHIMIENNLINWFSGILNHIRKELLYIAEKQ